MRACALMAWLGLVIPACVLPSVEVDEDFSPGGAGGSAGRPGTGGSAGLAGRGGMAGKGGSAGSAGTGTDEREDACIEYCDTYLRACTAHEANTYEDINDCAVKCATLGWPFDPNGQPEAPNSLQCRLLHAGFALASNPETHCFHAAEVPSNDKCEAE